ncbi:hypothetical protein FOCC_FOCC009611 [Frankliniella occidentalis]|nr:hypothetical protein FOCC_FOCC009611 [Frankliniella occidentalis]
MADPTSRAKLNKEQQARGALIALHAPARLTLNVIDRTASEPGLRDEALSCVFKFIKYLNREYFSALLLESRLLPRLGGNGVGRGKGKGGSLIAFKIKPLFYEPREVKVSWGKAEGRLQWTGEGAPRWGADEERNNDVDVLAVADPPEITVRPKPQVVRAGGVAYFVCAARGDPPPVIRWRRRARGSSAAVAAAALAERAKVLRLPGLPGVPGGGAGAAAGAAAASEGGARLLRIQNVQPRDAAAFICVAENSAGDAVSAEAQLTVLDDKRGTWSG